MSDFITHVAAIAVGVLVTLLLVERNNDATATPAMSSKKKASVTTAAAKGGNDNNNNQKKKNRNKNSKKTTAAAAVAAATVAAEDDDEEDNDGDVDEPIAFSETELDVFKKEDNNNNNKKKKTPQQKKKKNKKKKKNNNAANGNSSVAPVAVDTVTILATKPKPFVPTPYVQPRQARIVEIEVWVSVPIQKKKKTIRRDTTAMGALGGANGGATATMVPLVIRKEAITIDVSRVGLIIVPKSATMMDIHERTGGKVDVNALKKEETVGGGGVNLFCPVQGCNNTNVTAPVVNTEGNNEGRVVTTKASLETADRGYTALLQGEQVGEASIQTELNVNINIPKTEWTPKQILIGNIQQSTTVVENRFVYTLMALPKTVRVYILNYVGDTNKQEELRELPLVSKQFYKDCKELGLEWELRPLFVLSAKVNNEDEGRTLKFIHTMKQYQLDESTYRKLQPYSTFKVENMDKFDQVPDDDLFDLFLNNNNNNSVALLARMELKGLEFVTRPSHQYQ